MRGPFSLGINEELGCLVEGFDTPPMVMMPHHKAYQGGLIEAAGLAKHKDLYAWRYSTGDVPTGLKSTKQTSTSLTFAWNLVSGAKYYWIALSTSSSRTPRTSRRVPSRSTSRSRTTTPP